MESKDLGSQFLLNFSKEKIFKHFCKSDLTTCFKSTESNTGIPCISAGSHYTK